uniref:Uncharacterized protein n=1 Tax=Lactuca sativa TaxID=4236 RepID=A0A9R1V8Y8_LACSA|nr:hypothetical protein LSAT_V11C600333180 [Lactuca sativa]
MEFLQVPEIQIGIGFVVVIVTLVAFILFSSKKTKGSSYSINSLYFIISIPSSILAHGNSSLLSTHNLAIMWPGSDLLFLHLLQSWDFLLDNILVVGIDSKLGTDRQGEEVIKPYTPTTLDSDVGYFELVLKVTNLICAMCFYCFLFYKFMFNDESSGVHMLPAGSGMGVMCGMTRGIKMARPPSSSIMNSTTGLLTSSTPTSAQGNSMLRSREVMHMIRVSSNGIGI